MTYIDIDIRKIKQAATQLSGKEMVLYDARRKIGLIRWGIPDELSNKAVIEDRLNDVLQRLNRAEQLMRDIKSETNTCINQYVQAEERNLKNAKRFL